MIDNYNLCHLRTINWEEIITGQGAKSMYMYNFSNSERECPPCDKSCSGGCWGEGPHNCQKFSKINCSPQCYQGRCFGPKPRDCCHLFCAGGCTGPKQSDCLVSITTFLCSLDSYKYLTVMYSIYRRAEISMTTVCAHKNVRLCNDTILSHIPGKPTPMENMRMEQLALKTARSIYLKIMERVYEVVHPRKRLTSY